MKRVYVSRCLLLMLATILSACVGPLGTQNSVHLHATSFEPSSMSIKKGETITLVNDTMEVHIIENGRWDANETERPGKEPGAPGVDIQVGGNENVTIGPFNTPGTFWLYCTVHPGMNLTVKVS